MQTKLLPVKFKLIGIIVAIAAFAIPIILGIVNPEPWENTHMRRLIAQSIILLGLLFIILSRERTEDEFIAHCRVRAAASAFVFGIVYYIITSLMAFKNVESVYSAFRVLICEGMFYLLMFHLLLRGQKSAHE